MTLTFTSDQPGGLERSVTPDGRGAHRARAPLLRGAAAAGRQLQAAQGRPPRRLRRHRLLDYAQPIDQDLTQRYIARHRLEKKNPDAAPSEPVEPIVYYLDPGTPEPVRSALLEGGACGTRRSRRRVHQRASAWRCCPTRPTPWTRATTSSSGCTAPRAGGATATPSSIRAPARSSRATSRWARYGCARTTSSARGCSRRTPTATRTRRRSREMALQRIRQLAAHEIGHTLGLAHNYISQRAERPRRAVGHGLSAAGGDAENGQIHLGRDSYANQIGAWDKITIRYGYTRVPARAPTSTPRWRQILQEGIPAVSGSSPTRTRAPRRARTRTCTCGTTAPTRPTSCSA